MPTHVSSCFRCLVVLIAASLVAAAQHKAEDIHIKKSITVGGNFVSSAETSLKGPRERTVTQGPNGNTLTLRQCDLKRTLTLNEQTQTYLVTNDPQDENALRAAALATGGTAAAVVKLVRQLKGEVVGLQFVIELDFLKGREKLPGLDVQALVHY